LIDRIDSSESGNSDHSTTTNTRPGDVSEVFISWAHRLCPRSPIICDIGSRDAWDGLCLLRELGGKELHMFEPNPVAAARCRTRLAKLAGDDVNRVHFNEAAVGDKDGVSTFFPVNVESSENADIGFSSFYMINPQYMKRRGQIVQDRILVRTLTLDSYFAQRDKPDILWIDVEGAELSVLRGSEEILPEVSLIHLEVSFRPMQLGKPLFWTIDAYLRRCGFKFVSFVEVSWLKGFLYRYRLLPNSPWRVNAIYRRG
jgi:FkbM family methyltransferase